MKVFKDRSIKAAEAAGGDAAAPAEVTPVRAGEIIPAGEPKPVKRVRKRGNGGGGDVALGSGRNVTIHMPSFTLPSSLNSWILLAFGCWLWQFSVGATDSVLVQWFPGQVVWWHPYAVQVGFSAAERYLFTGQRNWLTLGMLLLDSLINGYGLFLDKVANFVGSGPVSLIETGFQTNFLVSRPNEAILAFLLGTLLAWSSDKIFSMTIFR